MCVCILFCSCLQTVSVRQQYGYQSREFYLKAWKCNELFIYTVCFINYYNNGRNRGFLLVIKKKNRIEVYRALWRTYLILRVTKCIEISQYDT